MPEPSISVIVPAYNCAGTISRILQAILSQDVSFQVEIVVVNDGSTDETPRILESFSGIRYIHQANSGPASARNRGATESRGEYLFFIDSDCVPHRDWIRKIMPHFQDPQVAVVAGSYGIANPQSNLASCIHQEILYRHHKLMPQYPRYFGGFNFAIRRETFVQVGGFDPTYRYASGEDNDLSYKIIGRGHKIFFARDALVDHFHTESLRKYLREQYRHGFWRMKMYLRHPRMSKGDDYTFWKDILEVPVVLLLVAGLVLSPVNVVSWKIFWIAVYGLVFLEIYFGFRMIKNKGLGIYWAYAMFLRSFARSFGFAAGAVNFLFLKIFSANS